jgi:hypothetical protein
VNARRRPSNELQLHCGQVNVGNLKPETINVANGGLKITVPSSEVAILELA